MSVWSPALGCTPGHTVRIGAADPEPDFLGEDSAVGDFFGPDRSATGSKNQVASEPLLEIYPSNRHRCSPPTPVGDSGRVYTGLPVGDPVRRQPDISVARSTLEREPVVPFVDGLRRTIAYLQDLRR
jgi:hypothetical protein